MALLPTKNRRIVWRLTRTKGVTRLINEDNFLKCQRSGKQEDEVDFEGVVGSPET